MENAMHKNWRELMKPKKVDIDDGEPHRLLRQVRLRAAGARLRHHHRQLPAAHPALLAAGRGHHQRPDRGRAPRVLDRPGRRRGRHRHHPQPQGGAAADARRGAQDAAHRRRGRGRGQGRRHHRRPDGRDHEPGPPHRHPVQGRPAARWRWWSRRAGATCPADRNKEEDQPIGVIPIDAIFSPGAQGQLHRQQRPRRPDDRLRQADPRGLDRRLGQARGRRGLRGQDPQGPALHLHQLRGGATSRPSARSGPRRRSSTRTSTAASTSWSSPCARPTA